MSRELGRGELLVCQIVGASLLAMVSALILNKGIESVFDRPQHGRSSQEQTYGGRSTNQNAKQANQSSLLVTPTSQRPAAGVLSGDSAGAAGRETKALAEALKVRGLQIASRLDSRLLEPGPIGKNHGPDVAIAEAVSIETSQAVPEQRIVTAKFASADSSSPGPLPETKPPPLPQEESFTHEDIRRAQSRLHDLGFLSSSSTGRWNSSSKSALHDFKLVNRLPNDDVLDLATRKKLNSPSAIRADQSFLGNWCRSAGTKHLQLTIKSHRTKSSAGGVCVFHNIQAENRGWRVRATCSERKETWNANGKITVTANKLVWVSDRDEVNYFRCSERHPERNEWAANREDASGPQRNSPLGFASTSW
jgi:hypothetical protein